MKAFAILFLIIASSTTSQASDKLANIAADLQTTVESLESNVDYPLVIESLYKQIRPRAKVTRNDLTPTQINNRVYQYITDEYSPALVGNFAYLYADMKKHNKRFSDCHTPNPINKNDDILKTLCIDSHDGDVLIRYMTNAYAQGWKDVAIFKFTKASGHYRLTAIDMLMTDKQQTYIDGI